MRSASRSASSAPLPGAGVVAVAAQPRCGDTDRDRLVGIAGARLAGAGSDPVPDLVPLGVAGLGDDEPGEHVRGHVAAGDAGRELGCGDDPGQAEEDLAEPVQHRPGAGEGWRGEGCHLAIVAAARYRPEHPA